LLPCHVIEFLIRELDPKYYARIMCYLTKCMQEVEVKQ